MRAEPLALLRPAPECAQEFAALPYDVFDTDEARAYLAVHPNSFLAIDRAETQFAQGQDPYAPEVYERAAELLREREADGTLVQDPERCYYLYRQEANGRAQTGIVAGCSIDEYEDGTIRRHENIRPAKMADRIAHVRTCGAHTGPIFLAFRDSAEVARVMERAMAEVPLYDFVGADGTRDTVWRVADAESVEALRAAFTRVDAAYIADGHHRCASAAQVGLDLRHENPEVGPRESDLFLTVLFPASELNCLPYNRVVLDRNGLSAAELVEAVQAAGFAVRPAAGPVSPERKGVFGMFADGAWYELEIDPVLVPEDAVASLDVQVLQDRVLAPILGIDDPGRSPRIRFVGGIRGTEELERRAGSEGVAFTLFPTTIHQVMAVADEGRLMPQKSTWFEPKIKSGLFIHRF